MKSYRGSSSLKNGHPDVPLTLARYAFPPSIPRRMFCLTCATSAPRKRAGALGAAVRSSQSTGH